MKSLLLLGAISLITLGASCFAYEPTSTGINTTWQLTERLVGRIQLQQWSPSAIATLQTNMGNMIARNTSNPDVQFILTTTKNAIGKLAAKSQDTKYFAALAAFRAKYDTGLVTPYDSPAALSTCFEHYPIVDIYARMVNIPTPLLLAMWYAESTCGMYNPANLNGVFQITANTYATGAIDVATLEHELNDFAIFMTHKLQWYYKLNPTVPHELGYTGFTYNALQTFAALYNGIDLDVGSRVYPVLNKNPFYFLGNYNADYAYKKDGLLVFFLKLAQREAQYFSK